MSTEERKEKAEISLHAEWVGLKDSRMKGPRARGVQVLLGTAVLLTLRFDRSIRIPQQHFLVGPMSNALLSLRIGTQPRAEIGGPRSAVALVNYLLMERAETQLIEEAASSLKGNVSSQVLHLLIGDALFRALQWMTLNNALSTTEQDRRRQIGHLLRMTNEIDVLWPFLCEHRAERLQALLLPLLPAQLDGLPPDTWIRTTTGRRDLLERARHFPLEWISAAADARPVTIDLVRPYLALWLNQLKRARTRLVDLAAPERLRWVGTISILCNRIVTLNALTKSEVGGEHVFSFLRLDAAPDVSMLLLAGLESSHRSSAAIPMVPKKLVSIILLRAANELHTAHTEQEMVATVRDLHLILDWMGAAHGIDPELLETANLSKLADEARLWRMMLEEVQEWNCVLLTSGMYKKVLQTSICPAKKEQTSLTIQPLCSDHDLALTGMTLRNCLGNSDSRLKYRRGCLRGVRRIFLLTNGAGRSVGVLSIAWDKEGWRVDEAKGPCNRDLDVTFQNLVKQFVEDYNRLQSNPYPVVDV